MIMDGLEADKHYTIYEVADVLRRSVSHLRNHLRLEPSYKKKHSITLYSKAEVDEAADFMYGPNCWLTASQIAKAKGITALSVYRNAAKGLYGCAKEDIFGIKRFDPAYLKDAP
jgi:hypothetical protein